jgi:hypothetical protein
MAQPPAGAASAAPVAPAGPAAAFARLVVGGSTVLNRFGGACSTPSTSFSHSAVRVRDLTAAHPAPATTDMALGSAGSRFRLLDLPPDTCCAALELLTPRDLGRLGAVATALRWLPRDNWLWFQLALRRFVGADAAPTTTIASRLNWEDEYQFLLRMEVRSRKFMVAQMQGRLGRLPPVPKRRNRAPINYFRAVPAALQERQEHVQTAQIRKEEAASGNCVLQAQALGNRQGSGAAAWSALKTVAQQPAGSGEEADEQEAIVLL